MKKIFITIIGFVCLGTFLAGNYSASFYGNELTSIGSHQIPFNLMVVKFDGMYKILDSKTKLGIIIPDDYFPLNKNIYIKNIEKICEGEKIVIIQVRDLDSKVKEIVIWQENNKLKSKLFNPEDLHYQNYNILYCTGLDQEPYFVKIWGIIGSFLLISLFLSIFLVFYDENK